MERVWIEGNPPSLLVGKSIGTTTKENSMEVPQKTKYRTKYMTQQSHSWAYIWTKQQFKVTCTRMFIAALLTIAKTWKHVKCPSTDEWIKKIWYIYTSFSHIIFHLVLSHIIGYSSLCYRAGPHCLSILNGIVCIYQPQTHMVDHISREVSPNTLNVNIFKT